MKLINNAKQECQNLKSLKELGLCWPAQSSWCSMSSKDTLKKLRNEIFENVMHHILKIIKDSESLNLRYESLNRYESQIWISYLWISTLSQCTAQIILEIKEREDDFYDMLIKRTLKTDVMSWCKEWKKMVCIWINRIQQIKTQAIFVYAS